MTGAIERSHATDERTEQDDDPAVVKLTDRDRRSIAVNGLFVLAVLLTVYMASSLLIPIAVALLLSILLAPAVALMANRAKVPEPIGAALIVAAVLSLVIVTVASLTSPAQRWFERVPQNFFRIEAKLRPFKEPIANIEAATEQLDKATELGERPPMRVMVERPGLTEQFLTGTPRALASVGMVILLLYFLLASGDTFLRKVVTVTPAWEDKKRAVEIIRSIQSDIAFYLRTITMLNVGIGTVIGLTAWAIGLPDPVLWGTIVTVLSFAPYAGSAVIAAILSFVGLLTFDTWSMALLPAAAYLVMMFLSGNVVIPFVLGRRLTLSPLAIFVSIIFWGWMWGVVGALVAVPLLASFKIVCERVDSLKGVAEFLTP